MAIGINDLDFEDEDYGSISLLENPDGNIDELNYVKPLTLDTTLIEPPTGNEPPSGEQEEDDLIKELLHSKGITDPNKIKFEDENGLILDKNWNSLTKEEQYNILATPNNTPETGLDDLEIALINSIRLAGISPLEYILAVGLGAINQYSQLNPPEPTYKVDEISDDELYMIDLKARTPDITDEELTSALESAKLNESLYKKQIQGIRKEYQDLEQQRNQEEAAVAQQELLDQFNQFANQIADSINNLDEVAGLDIELDDDDKEELADFILGNDAAGLSNLGKAINDPETLTKMCWFALKGVDTIDGMVDYFKNEIKKVRESSYKLGYEAAGGKQPPRVVVTPPKPTVKTFSLQLQGQITSIDDLD